MHEAVREMTFEEEYEVLQKESKRVFTSEKEGCEPPLANCVLRRALRCIRKLQEQQPKTDWIPCEVEMPKEHDSIFAKLKGTDKWKSSMFEKVSDVVNVTIEDQNGKGVTVHACTTDGNGVVICCELTSHIGSQHGNHFLLHTRKKVQSNGKI